MARHDIRQRQVRCEMLQVVPTVPGSPVVDVDVKRRENQANGWFTHGHPV